MLYAFLAFLPIALTVVMMLVFNCPAKKALITAWGTSVLTGFFVWKMDILTIIARTLCGILGSFDVLLIIFGAILIMNTLKKSGATEVYAAATHGILSNPAIERIANSELVELVISDSISLPEEKKIDKIKVLTVANMLAKAIEYIQKGSSMNVVYDLYKDKR